MDSRAARQLLQAGQRPQVAFAGEKGSALALAETLAALANSEGGSILIGVTNAGSLRGVRDADAASNKALSAALQITPPLVLPIPQTVELGGRTLVAIQVPRGLPDVYAISGRYLTRDGTENRPLEPGEVHSLMLRRGMVRFETLVPEGATLDDLDMERVRQYANRIEQLRQQAPERALLQRACAVQSGALLRPTHAGLLLFGSPSLRWLSGAEITAARYLGSEMSDRFVREDISGPLPDQILRAEAFLRANTAQEVTLEGVTHEAKSAYPHDVLREVIVNAVAHRDYGIQGDCIRVMVFSDRVQVYSPGRLPGHVTVENIEHERFSRNPVIVQVLADMGFIERLGYGIDRLLRSLQKAGHPAPHFEETVAGFQVTLYAKTARRHTPPRHPHWRDLDLTSRQQEAVEYVLEHQRITNREYQKLCPDVSAETIRRDLLDLVHKNVLLRIGRKRATYYILKDADWGRTSV